MPAKIYPYPWIMNGPMVPINLVAGGLMASDLSTASGLWMSPQLDSYLLSIFTSGPIYSYIMVTIGPMIRV